MDLVCDERPSDSSFVDRIWRSQSDQEGAFVSIANIHCGLVVSRYQGKTTLTVRGPETRATPAYCPADAEFFGIVFKPGTFMSDMPARMVMDRQDINLPEASSRSFWLKSSAWQFPDFENADTFVDRLVRNNMLVHDPVVNAVLQGHTLDASQRTVQRRFLQATGLTQGTLAQIERARYATTLLKNGVSILDTVIMAGYFDQPHLTRSLKHFIGQTPAQLLNINRSERLSFLYKTEPAASAMLQKFDSGYQEHSDETDHRIGIPIARRRYGSAGELALPFHE